MHPLTHVSYACVQTPFLFFSVCMRVCARLFGMAFCALVYPFFLELVHRCANFFCLFVVCASCCVVLCVSQDGCHRSPVGSGQHRGVRWHQDGHEEAAERGVHRGREEEGGREKEGECPRRSVLNILYGCTYGTPACLWSVAA